MNRPLIRRLCAAILVTAMAGAAGMTAQPVRAGAVQQAPYAYCFTVRHIRTPGATTYYYSRVFPVPGDGPTLGYQPQFESHVSARYTSEQRGSGASCVRFYGRAETEQRMNDAISTARRNGARIVITHWAP